MEAVSVSNHAVADRSPSNRSISNRSIPSRVLARWAGDAGTQMVAAVLVKPLQVLIAAPSLLFLGALAAMLLRHPDVPFYAIDRVAFGLLVAGVLARTIVQRERLFVIEMASWPMAALTMLAVASVAGQPFDNEAWSLLAAKFLVPFTLFHLARAVFQEERALRQFEVFALAVLAYLSFTAIAFLVGAKELIFPSFILDPSLGHHADRARGPLLQAVANGVSLNILGLLAWHAFQRGKFRGMKARLLLASVPVAVLATMTRAVWLSLAGTILVLMVRFRSGRWRGALGLALLGSAGLFCVLNCPELESTLADRFEERGPVDFRAAVYAGGWQMFLERPLTGWGINQMPRELARHVSGYKEKVLYPHNTYLELLVEHGVAGLALYVWLMWEIWRLGRGHIPRAERSGFLDRQFHILWPILLGVYWVNAALVVMNYQFVNGLVFTLAGMLAAQQRRASVEAWREAWVEA
jgi:putative inorganic carbon (HCO3(-)) transporter